MLSYLIDSGIVVVSWFLRSACSAQRFVLTLTSLPVGNWIPWEFPTKKLLTLISSKMKNQKKKGVIRERKNPVVPSLALEDKQVYSEEEDCVAYKYYPQCWICSHCCQFCLKQNDFFPKCGKSQNGVSTFCFRFPYSSQATNSWLFENPNIDETTSFYYVFIICEMGCVTSSS